MIEIRNIKKSEFDKSNLIRLIQKFSKLQKDLLVSFDGRLKDFGDYSFNSEKKIHQIRISSKNSVYDFTPRVPEMLSTLLHELKHAQQQEDLGSNAFTGKSFSCNKNIKNEGASDFFSVREVEARLFEQQNILSAIDFYCKHSNTVIG